MVMPGAVTLLKAGTFKLGWSKVLGLHLSAGDAHSASYGAYTDDAWHYVSAGFDGGLLTLAVDGKRFPSAAISADKLDMDGPLTVGYDPEAAMESFFNGQVDELSLWAASRAGDARPSGLAGFDHLLGHGAPHLAGYGMLAGEAPASGLAGYFRFNDVPANEVSDLVTGKAWPLGAAGADEPSWIASTVVMGNAFNTTEEAEVTMHLPCASSHAESLDAVVVALPLHGELYMVDPETHERIARIESVPAILKGRMVSYESGLMGPERMAHFGGPDGAEWGDFRYVCVGDLEELVSKMTSAMLYDLNPFGSPAGPDTRRRLQSASNARVLK
eukprot:334737-Pyramimonas_sp.AAC.1